MGGLGGPGKCIDMCRPSHATVEMEGSVASAGINWLGMHPQSSKKSGELVSFQAVVQGFLKN